MFQDRQEAGKKLGSALAQYAGGNTVVYALPRGGVVVGYEIAKALDARLDLVITRKVGHPHAPEYAVCAVAEDGELICNEGERASLDARWLAEAVARERREAKRRRALYLKDIEHLSARNKVAIIVDDGIATGLTIRAAVRSLRAQKPQKLVVAVPLAPREVAQTLRGEVDDLVILEDDPSYLGAVGAYYEDFPQVSDTEVIEILKHSRG